MARVSCTFGGGNSFFRDEPNDIFVSEFLPKYKGPDKNQIIHPIVNSVLSTFTSASNDPFEISSSDEDSPKTQYPTSILKNSYQKNTNIEHPPINIEESPRVPAINNVLGSEDSSDDLLLPTEMTNKILAAQNTSNTIIDKPLLIKHGLNLPPILTCNENQPNINRHSRLLGEKSKTPQEAHSFWNNANNDTDFMPIEMPNSARGNPPTCDTPSRMMLEMKIHEMQATIDQINTKWEQKFADTKRNSRIRTERLLSTHSIEQSNLDAKFIEVPHPEYPTHIKAILRDGPLIVAKFKRLSDPNCDTASLDYDDLKKELIKRHTQELIQLNDEIKLEFELLKKRKEKELERPKAKLDTMVSEYNALPGTKKIQAKLDSRLIPVAAKPRVSRVIYLVNISKP
ncbi:hypothetical protein TVAG_393140 [Trichomonas vaginalis G3]|uniref:Uncharacterized protein n=1 Tax=Trichomonas vaginalis (strain ATCC PRA-98 / G3) TaxID=412133 RepID=A2DYB0_TRIV3|nr:hypothetical protein TVAGG3_0281670 [Trichomonas vaginalis G3]EAY14587.1 hypothetical protein TVAG_393140 [Trichomonas vaginalis G3]KAI5526598.1 hypothetical protein TVAGG3_0281670 [Trichomonas vaginalis G3]|eukprot:XP_001326810.1 hypothetical protein [Trichomonas vaginalis G3]